MAHLCQCKLSSHAHKDGCHNWACWKLIVTNDKNQDYKAYFCDNCLLANKKLIDKSQSTKTEHLG